MSVRRGRWGIVAAGAAAAVVLLSPAPARAVTFNFNPAPGTPANVVTGFNEAALLWTSLISDNVTINIDIAYQALGPGVLGSASSTRQAFTYSAVRSALISDAVSSTDSTAVANLPSGSSFNMLLNYTNNSPNGVGSPTPYLDNDGDANNTTVRMTTANAKALGLISGTDPATDASITFSSDFPFDFDRSNGISPGSYDFVGVAAHEIGHSLGFISGVDILDINSPNGSTYFNDNAFTYVATADLFRFSSTSYALGAGTIDWTTNTTPKYFSIDGGASGSLTFSTGVNHGDGQQASHWEDNEGIGIMDPTAAAGELLAISSNDQTLLDTIGWNLGSGSGTPEPATLGPLALAGLGFYLTGRRRWLLL